MIDFPSPTLIGVIHLSALPGQPTHTLSMTEIVERALADARTLQQSGFDAAIIENFGDMPFTAGLLPPASVAAMAVVADHVRRACELRLGINALRNDPRSAIGIAATVGASFIRVNVHTGVAATDVGIVEGQADDTLRYRKQLGNPIAILADVHVKHATPMSERSLELAAKEVAYRGLADGLIVTGPATGEAVDLDDLRRVRAAVPDRPVLVGSGATVKTVTRLLEHADGIIVGTAIKTDGVTANPVDESLAKAFTQAAGRA